MILFHLGKKKFTLIPTIIPVKVEDSNWDAYAEGASLSLTSHPLIFKASTFFIRNSSKNKKL